ncbi:MAG TPA: helix-hairpin-helix domain-containing protein [Pricia sp.]|nr:helix-hairpin-helix domain-containing protein [Pricia sp.]
MNKLQSHFRFNKQERSGIFFLLLIIVSLQVGYYFYGRFSKDAKQDTFVVDHEIQTEIDALKQAALKKDSVKIYPFNPNFITDYKGYVLGMSTDEIDRLHAFRKKDKFANTAEKFQKVTQVSDSLLEAISPHFKFPEWTKTRKRSAVGSKQYGVRSRSSEKGSSPREGSDVDSQNVAIKDLNTATAQELRTINGIGEKLSTRILKFRDRLGGFLSDDQLYDVYGLDPEVVERSLEKFKVLKKPDIPKINVNTASAYEIATLVYIQKQVAESIVEYRNVNNGILSLDELENIEGFPSDKIDRIALYLSL